ncbi:hypothetical protein HK107_13140 [Parvularcula sp. ZS-1/3]|uniref:Redoxin domain-containing protein n=1 Tax=Parvularcula mediterranea TaxID=2732508 RepID=A0A7Y3RNF0_9PROT|nr:hypothetical protein [Parvularcula mediterranea]NNU17269.1 hypothetical protein [Parvularcula mediterranea]
MRQVFRVVWALALCVLAACATPPKPSENTGQRVVGTVGNRAVIPTRAPIFPQITARNLDGQAVRLPSGLPGARSLVVIAFEIDQQSVLEEWSRAFGLETARSVPWVGIAAPAPGYEIFSDAITSRLRSETPRASDRKRLFTFFDRNALLAGLQVSSVSEPLILVATRDGDVVTMVRGRPTTEKIRRLRSAL